MRADWCATIVVALICVGWVPTTLADEIKYDSSSCTPDAEGMVYVALGETVFRWPEEELSLVGAVPPSQMAALPKSPDPSQPEGCPGNPIRGANFSFLYRYDALLAAKRGQQNPTPYPVGAPESLRLIAASPDSWGTQPSNERMFLHVCDEWEIKEVLPNGLIACSAPPDDKTKPRNTWATFYQALPDVYGVPFDRPFVVKCLYIVTVMQCNVIYKLYRTVNITYQFWRGRLPISQIIEFDRGLRKRLESHRVPNFIWRHVTGPRPSNAQ